MLLGGRRVEGLAELEHHAGGAQLRAGVGGRQRRVHDDTVGKLLARQVVVADHHVEPRRPRRGHGLDGRDATVDRDQQAHAPLGQPLDGAGGQPVALVEAAGQLPDGIRAEGAQRSQEDRRRADAVHVVVAEHGDAGAAPDVGADQLGGRRDTRQGQRVVALVGVQERAGILDGREAAPRQDRADRARHAQPGGELLGDSHVIRGARPSGRPGEHPTHPVRKGGRNA